MITRSGVAGRWILRERGLPGLGPTGIRRLLNLITVVLATAALIQWGDPDLILDALWVTIAIGAFLYGLRASLARIVVATAVIVIDSAMVAMDAGQGFELDLLDLTDWALLIVISIVVAIMADRLASTARRYAALYRQASDRLVTANEEERRRLARDLHDGVGQTLTAVILTLDAAEAALATEVHRSASPITTREAIRQAKGLASTALDEARDVATRLRPARISEIGLGAATRGLAETAGIPVDVRFDPAILPPGLLEPEREIDLYRILQEAIGNAARHSHAKHVWIDGEVRDGLIHLTVGDDGVGFDPSAMEQGMGLAGLLERADILLGRVEVQSSPGAGTIVNVTIPVPTVPVADRPPTVGDAPAPHPAG
jgi:signal transduction histidine kinase